MDIFFFTCEHDSTITVPERQTTAAGSLNNEYRNCKYNSRNWLELLFVLVQLWHALESVFQATILFWGRDWIIRLHRATPQIVLHLAIGDKIAR